MILQLLSSVRLTLALLLGLSLVSIFGTLKPAAEGRYELFYQSPWFRVLLVLLAINMTVCTAKTILRNLRERADFMEVLRSELVFARPLRYVLPADSDPALLAIALRRQGYRVRREEERLLARKGLPGRWGSTVVHLSFLAIMLGALLAEAGFVGTLNIYVGDKSAVYFDWEKQRDMPLGFEFRLDYFEPLYYPVELRFTASDPRTGKVLATYTAKEGETVDLPIPGLRAKVLKFDHQEKLFILSILRGGTPLGEYFVFEGGEKFGERDNPGVQLQPVAYREPVLKQLHSEVSILEQGRVVERGTIEVNHPFTYKGVDIYQTAFDRDKFGFWYAGFQFSKDPGEPVVWIGCLFMILGLLLAFAVPHRAVGVTRADGEVLLVALAGFRSEAGVRAFDRLESRLSEMLKKTETSEAG